MSSRAATGVGADLAHASPPQHTPTRSISRSSRPPPATSSPATPSSPNYYTNSDSSHHRHKRTTSGARYSQDAAARHDYEPSPVARHPPRSPSRDKAPPPASSRGIETRHPRRSTSHSDHSSRRPPEMSPSATAPASSSGRASTSADAPASSSGTKSRSSRTSIPTQSGKWILGKTIGEGSMGKVKLARKEDGSEQVACKIIPRGSTESHQSRADKERADQSKEIRTAREAAIVTLLNHPHICGLRDVVRTNYHWYMLFEFVNGGQMLDYIISHGKLKEKQARKFSRQIASALDYCHKNSIVHRDLKIENILISKTGDIKIIDFGLSNLFSPRGHLKTFCGSLYFAAPELLQARAYTGPEVDVWSFGIVLYVLVCGKVPFDDQSMPALHAKIKKGLVEYPGWLSNECKHLMSRMLVTDPKQRATMQEVMGHPWMTKGYSGPPENHLPPREPLEEPLDADVITAMQGFNFGSPEHIEAQLIKTIESEEYQHAVRLHQKEKEAPQPQKDVEKKRGFGFDFYKRRNSANSRDTLTAPSSDTLQLGNDALNAFSPLLSIYYLVKEKREREGGSSTQLPSSSSRDKIKERERERERDKDKERERERERERTREREREKEKVQDAIPELTPPRQAHVNSGAYEMPGEKPTGGRTRPRARTQGEEDEPDILKQTRQKATAEKLETPVKKEGTAAGLLRRFSTRKKRDPSRHERDRSHPPVVQVHTPTETSPAPPRKSFSIRRGRNDVDDGTSSLRNAESPRQHSDLLSPPKSAGAGSRPRGTGLGRSTSVNSGDYRRRETSKYARDHAATSGSDQSVGNAPSPPQQRGHSHSQSMAVRTKSLGHARRESVQQRRLRREAAHEADVPEETDQELDQPSPSNERLGSSDLAKPVFLKGLFSVSTTSGKSVPAIRAEIRRVLKQLNVEYDEIKGGFACRHAPSIDLNKVQDPVVLSPGQGGGHRRRFSFGGLMRGDEKDQDEIRDLDRPSIVSPRAAGRYDKERSDRDRSYSNSETSVDSIPRRAGGSTRRAPGETSTQVQSDLGGSMVLEFEIFIVKVPLLSLHGIQFKRMTGNTWQFKSMADQVLKDLKL